jgi:hypothetical protein
MLETESTAFTPYFQEIIAYAGTLDCYGKSQEVIEKFTRVKVSLSSVFRITNSISKRLEKEDIENENAIPPLSNRDILYVQIDGSMIQTRTKDEPWKEVKLGRLFRGVDCSNPNTKVAQITDSQYVGHFGRSVDFGLKLKTIIDAYGELKDRLIFVCDGAAWIREWIADTYPLSVSILDYYHVLEYLYDFANKVFSDRSLGRDWCRVQEELLLGSKVGAVIQNINMADVNGLHKSRIVAYYTNNKGRMNYGYYRQVGSGIIGSGAIESAHRTVIQHRMKLSGQRWGTDGARNMLRMRIILKNRQWQRVEETMKTFCIANAA